MYGVLDGASTPNKYPPVIGARWWCPTCEVGVTSQGKPRCWCCDGEMGPYPYRAPTTPNFHLTAPPPEEP